VKLAGLLAVRQKVLIAAIDLLGVDRLQAMQGARCAAHRHQQHAGKAVFSPLAGAGLFPLRPGADAQAEGRHTLSSKVRVIVRRRFGAVPDRIGFAARLVSLGLRISLAFGTLDFHASTSGSLLLGCELAANVRPPILPPEPIDEALETTGRYTIEVQQIGAVLLAFRSADQLAAMELAVSVEAIRQEQPADRGGGAELVEDRGGIDHSTNPLNTSGTTGRPCAASIAMR
jgi:hypothetical protein